MIPSQSKRITVALVITELEVGGAERCLTNLALGLDPQRFKPIVYSIASRPPADRDALVQQLEENRITVRFLDSNSVASIAQAVRHLKKAWQSDRPQVAQAFLFHANVLTAIATTKSRPPVLSFGFRVSDPSRWRQQVERWLSHRAHQVVCVSNSVAEFAIDTVGIQPEKVIVIPNGIQPKQRVSTKPAGLTQLGIPDNTPTLTCVARLTQQKGVDRLIRAAPAIFRELPDHHVLLVGDGPQQNELRELTRQLGVSDHVHFAGWRPDVTEILLASRLLILPSRWEGMPNVILEAMACGLPVVSTRTDGVTELLGPVADEQTVSDGTPQAIADKVVKLCSDPHLRAHLGAENRQRVTQKFSLERMIADYERLFEALAISAEVI
jgi:starch synthase (maltosyl-transferring)